MVVPTRNLILVTGAHGFIGSHVVRRLLENNYLVRAVDRVHLEPPFLAHPSLEVIFGNLCDPDFCVRVTQGVHTLMHFAANMGGMGTIHTANDTEIYQDNQLMLLNLVSAVKRQGIRKVFFASSACVYPDSLQSADDPQEVSLKETDAWSSSGSSPDPQGMYGLEKLVSEAVLHKIPDIELRIARFHNVYGPGGAWCGGREKAPAAFLRKALAMRKLLSMDPNALLAMEVWGNGTQRRSFLYIDDCVEGILRLLEAESSSPIIVNIGSDTSVSVQNLAVTALGVIDPDLIKKIDFHYDGTKPVGVASRNSDNTLVTSLLGWRPTTSLENGLRSMVPWMEQKMDQSLVGLGTSAMVARLHEYCASNLVFLEDECTRFAILLPVTSRGTADPGDCLRNLMSFAQSLRSTTWRDTHQRGGTRYRYTIYLVIDHDDTFLCDPSNSPEQLLLTEGAVDVVTLTAKEPPGAVCSLWRLAARRAWEDRCDYYVLLGDDVTLLDEGWMQQVDAEFATLSSENKCPRGFGCVAFTDISFPGMPTFPILHRRHLDIFQGEVVPTTFVNQDGDPFLYQLYRRWGCSKMFSSRVQNGVGGSVDARYTKQHAPGWTFDPLTSAVQHVEEWLQDNQVKLDRKLALDIVIPSYRVQIHLLEAILELVPSSTCSVMFIIIIDNPNSPKAYELNYRFGSRPDVRIRVNPLNLGASASRNRGIQESSGDYIHFLDDDVVPKPDLLIEAEKAIRAHPGAAGFVGNSQFPLVRNLFTTAIHLAGVTYFWDIATKKDVIDETDVPWGVTANLIVKRDNDGVLFNLDFPKTGGGEDIAFCREKRDISLRNGGQGFVAAPDVVVVHPWWSEGQRSYRRFFMWSYGDGSLVKKFPALTYLDIAPNSAEIFLLLLVFLVHGLCSMLFRGNSTVFSVALRAIACTTLSNIIHDLYRHLFRHRDRVAHLKTQYPYNTLNWVFAIMESALIRMASEGGRLVGMVQRGELQLFMRRFDWFANTAGNGPRNEERWNNAMRLIIALELFWISCP